MSVFKGKYVSVFKGKYVGVFKGKWFSDYSKSGDSVVLKYFWNKNSCRNEEAVY